MNSITSALRSPGKWTVFTLVAIAVFMSTLDSSIVNVALPAIMSDMHVPLHTIEWVVVIYLLTVSAFLLTFGRLSDIRGRRWVYCRGFLIFSTGSALCATALGPGWLIAARSFQGLGAAMLMARSPALVVDIFPARERGKALGLVGMVVASGLTIGPALGGLLIKVLSWRAIFYINIPIGLAAAALASVILRGGAGDIQRNESFDWAGAVLLILCLCTFFLPLVRALDWGLLSFKTLSLMAVSLLLAIFLYRLERKTRYPVFDPSLLKIRNFSLPIVSAVILFAGLFTIVFLMPFYLVNPMGLSIDKAGYTMVIPFLFLFIVSPFSGALSDRMGSRALCTVGMAILALSLFCLSRLSVDSSYLDVAWRLGLTGIGTSIFLPPNSNIAMSALPPNRRGIASGTVAVARNIGMVIGVAQTGLIFNTVFRSLNEGNSLKVYSPELANAFMAAFSEAMLAGCALACVGVVVAFLRGPDSYRNESRKPKETITDGA